MNVKWVIIQIYFDHCRLLLYSLTHFYSLHCYKYFNMWLLFTTPKLEQGMMKLSANLLRSMKMFAKICNNQHDVLIRRRNETLIIRYDSYVCNRISHFSKKYSFLRTIIWDDVDFIANKKVKVIKINHLKEQNILRNS